MLPNHIKNKVKELWNKFWSGGISNPLNAIEQITYLLFLKQLDETDIQKNKESIHNKVKYNSIFEGTFQLQGETNKKKRIRKNTLRWSEFTKKSPDDMYYTVQTQVFPFI